MCVYVYHNWCSPTQGAPSVLASAPLTKIRQTACERDDLGSMHCVCMCVYTNMCNICIYIYIYMCIYIYMYIYTCFT